MANTQQAPKVRGPELEPHQIILRPLITEKGQHQSTGRHRAYPFEVNPWASKEEIKAAAEELFGVQVDKVRTQNRRGKSRHERARERAPTLVLRPRADANTAPDEAAEVVGRDQGPLRPGRGDLERVVVQELTQVVSDALAERQVDALRVVDEQPQPAGARRLYEQHFDVRLDARQALLNISLRSRHLDQKKVAQGPPSGAALAADESEFGHRV